jgi:hypothetical protein
MGAMAGQPRYSEPRRRAVVSAVLDEGMTAAEVSRAAAAGELGNVGAFEIPGSTVRDMAQAARRDEPTRGANDVSGETDDELSDAVKGEARRLLAIVRAQLDQLEGVEGAASTKDLHRAQQVGSLLRQLAALAQAPTRRAPAGRLRPTRNGDDDFIGALANAHHGNGTG